MRSKVYEILDSAMDKAQAGFASKIDVVLHAYDSVSICDDGHGVCCISFLTFPLSLIYYYICLPFPDSTMTIDQYQSVTPRELINW